MTGVSLGGGCTSDGDRGCRCASDGDREADARPTSTGRRMRVRHRRGGGWVSSIAQGGGCASGITRGGDGASGIVRGGGCASSFDREVDACPAVVGKAERSGRNQQGGAVPADGRAVSGYSGMVGGGLSGSAGATVPRGRELVGPACKTRPA
jgi:hypothetical protein